MNGMRDYDREPNFWFSCMPRLSLFRVNTVKEYTQTFLLGKSFVSDWTIVHSYDAMQGFEAEMIRDLRKFFDLATHKVGPDVMITVEFIMVEKANIKYGVPCFNFIMHTRPDVSVANLVAMTLTEELPICKAI